MNPVLLDLLKVAATFGAAWLAVDVKFKWLRADIDRAHRRLDKHDGRFEKIERERWEQSR